MTGQTLVLKYFNPIIPAVLSKELSIILQIMGVKIKEALHLFQLVMQHIDSDNL